MNKTLSFFFATQMGGIFGDSLITLFNLLSVAYYMIMNTYENKK